MLARDPEFLEHLDRVFHRFPIRSAAHDDSDFGFLAARHRRILTKFPSLQ
jgi:hypothetical protein